VNITDLPQKRAHRIIYITLLLIIGLLIISLITGTIFGLARRGNEPVTANQFQAEPVQTDDIRIFSGLGRLRITLANSSILILSISFPYYADDTAFTEELAAKVNDFKLFAEEYFQSLDAQALIHIDEEAAKQEILRRFNNNLRLGRINVLYFHDLMIIEAL